MKAAQRTLGELLAGIVPGPLLEGRADQPISGIFDDSRQVIPGGLFVAIPGVAVDGRQFIADALARGAAAVLAEGPTAALSATVLPVENARLAIARLAQRWHRLDLSAATGLQLLGVTGTNGKSTTAMMARAIVESSGRPCALLGTVVYDLCGRTVTANMTTPAALQLTAYLAEAAGAGARAAVMEVSSHALHQHRTDGLRFAAAGFTNLSGDHLDYHGTMEQYAAAKRRLFEQLEPDATAVVNADDPAQAEMLRGCRARVLRYSFRPDAEISAAIVKQTIDGTTWKLRMDRGEVALESQVIGRHNVYNAMCAAGLAAAIGVPLEAIVEGLRGLATVPGRLQRVACAAPADVFVDYAHSDDALRNVLSVLKPLTRGRLVLVFGCGGERDRTKRPRMAAAAEEFADAIIVTSDNPRSEEPLAIIHEILAGFTPAGRRRVLVEPDRRKAIGTALSIAAQRDVVLLAGKGHENYQLIGPTRTHFDDAEVAIEAAAGLTEAARA